MDTQPNLDCMAVDVAPVLGEFGMTAERADAELRRAKSQYQRTVAEIGTTLTDVFNAMRARMDNA